MITAGVLVAVGLALTVIAGPLYGFAEHAAADQIDHARYVAAVLPGGVR